MSESEAALHGQGLCCKLHPCPPAHKNGQSLSSAIEARGRHTAELTVQRGQVAGPHRPHPGQLLRDSSLPVPSQTCEGKFTCASFSSGRRSAEATLGPTICKAQHNDSSKCPGRCRGMGSGPIVCSSSIPDIGGEALACCPSGGILVSSSSTSM